MQTAVGTLSKDKLKDISLTAFVSLKQSSVAGKHLKGISGAIFNLSRLFLQSSFVRRQERLVFLNLLQDSMLVTNPSPTHM